MPASSPAPLIEAFVRRLTASPPPRGLPYWGLESASGTGAHLLDALSGHGIFRKYEMVLDLAGGLGGTGRWLAGRLGCTAVVTAADRLDAAGGRALTRRTPLRGRVHHVRAVPERLPFHDARFTHVWAVEALARIPEVPAALAEAFRVVRPGGYLAVQELVLAGGAALEVTGWRFATAAARQASLVAAGFADVTLREVGDAAEPSAVVNAARQQFQVRLAAAPAQAAIARERAALTAAIAGGDLRVVQLFARRP